MAWNGSGTFSRTNGTHTGSTTWVQDRDAGAYILAGRHDTHDQDLADGINACLTKNNETKPTADFRPNSDGDYDLGSASLTWAQVHAGQFICYTASVPTNGMYLAAANTVGFAANSVKLVTVGATATSGLEGLSIYDSGDANGATLELVGDGATTPKKYIRVKGGVFEILNNAYDNVRLSLTDAGSLTVDGVMQADSGFTTASTSNTIPPPAFGTSAITMNTGYTAVTLKATKDCAGTVHLRGIAVKDSSASGALTYFTLAAGYRPAINIFKYIYNSTDGAVLCSVDTSGNVTVTHETSNSANTSFDISFNTAA